MSCLNSIEFNLLLNGRILGNVVPSRDLRHGDPLSPYLFILCSKILARLIEKEQ